MQIHYRIISFMHFASFQISSYIKFLGSV